MEASSEPTKVILSDLDGVIWLAHQAIHIEGHGYSCTPDWLDQLLLPFYEAELKASEAHDNSNPAGDGA